MDFFSTFESGKTRKSNDMKCYRHPQEDALFQCTNCGKPVCGDCMNFGDDSEVTCPVCTLDSTAAVHLEEMEKAEQVYQGQVDKVSLKKTLREHLDIRFNSYFLVALVALIVLNLYLSREIGKSQELIDYSDSRIRENTSPAAQFTYLLARIFHYRENHKKWPKKLSKLTPNLIDTAPNILKSQEEFRYTIDPKHGFVLSLPKARRFRFLKLYVSADGETNIE